ncbi:hypothetical protein VPHD148_0088 [Vibrio phage D148]
MSNTYIAVVGFKEEGTPQRVVAYKYESAITTLLNNLSSKEGPFTPEVKCSFKIVDGGVLVDLFSAYCYLNDTALPKAGFTKLENDWWMAPSEDQSVVATTHGLLQMVANVGEMEMRRKNGGCI